MEIRILKPSDLDAAYRLSTQANWNQLPADWQRLIDLWPEHCFAGFVGPQLVATGILATYNSNLAWIGMILVDMDFRHLGLGTLIFDAIIHHAEQIGIELLALDATHLGRPLYQKFGFVDRKPINRWIYRGQTSALKFSSMQKSTSRPIRADDWPTVCSFDQQAVQADRSMLLRHLAAEPRAKARLLEVTSSEISNYTFSLTEQEVKARSHKGTSRIEGIGFYRQGRYASMIAPLLAHSPDQAALLLDDLLGDHLTTNTDVPLLIDVLENDMFHHILASRGFTTERKLMRMVRPVCMHPALDTPYAFAGSGFEMG